MRKRPGMPPDDLQQIWPVGRQQPFERPVIASLEVPAPEIQPAGVGTAVADLHEILSRRLKSLPAFWSEIHLRGRHPKGHRIFFTAPQSRQIAGRLE
jgi:hypothetical protein